MSKSKATGTVNFIFSPADLKITTEQRKIHIYMVIIVIVIFFRLINLLASAPKSLMIPIS